MSPQDPQTAALLAHVVSQVESNVQFLVSQNYISHADASAFLAKLPGNTTSAGVGVGMGGGAISSLTSRVKSMVTSTPTPPVRNVVQARALWAYNENGQDADDLSFSAGDIIEILEETNADWWMGKVNGRQALFPSSYVEKLPSSTSTAFPSASSTTKQAYKPFGAALHGRDAPPPSGEGTNSVGLQQAPGTEEKKSKFGKYGNTMAHSAAGGVGFGAGAAIGGGLVRAIF
ncbi:Protein csh3 [Hypsizygus marmoreus]|uniref:Protein csh3 n=1 Tax=Hypsizygus marmoreus TaxID=39966 RepID=A0A369K9V9_HYPMA|nr:Protein csh3 [Hypsizygus marmoreus]